MFSCQCRPQPVSLLLFSAARTEDMAAPYHGVQVKLYPRLAQRETVEERRWNALKVRSERNCLSSSSSAPLSRSLSAAAVYVYVCACACVCV